MQQYAITLRDIAQFVCIDDKHRIKVEEPGFPVTAVERGTEVIVSLNENIPLEIMISQKFSVIPSVTLVVDIQSMDGSWYREQVFLESRMLYLNRPLLFDMRQNSITVFYHT